MPEMKGPEYLRNKLKTKKPRCNRRYAFYEMKHVARASASKMIPSELNWMMGVFGWSTDAVDSLANRLQVRGFRNDNFAMGEIYDLNNPDIIYDSAITSALITSCCFIYIYADDAGNPKMEVIDGTRATGVIDETTGMLREGYAVLEVDKMGRPTLEAYFESGLTTFYPRDGASWFVENPAPYPLLVPIIHKPDAKRPFGHSIISRACMYYQDAAVRTVFRSEVAAEFFAVPQKYVLGTDPDSEPLDKALSMMRLLEITKDADGDKPTVGTFQTQSMAPFTEQLKMFASLFAGEAGLTLDDIGFPTSNPASYDAIVASHEKLKLKARKAQRGISTGFLNAGYLAACLRDDKAYDRSLIARTSVRWYPVFEPSAATISQIGDGLIKLSQAMPEADLVPVAEDLTGLDFGGSDFTDLDRLLAEEERNG